MILSVAYVCVLKETKFSNLQHTQFRWTVGGLCSCIWRSTQFQNLAFKPDNTVCSCFRQSQSAKLHLYEKSHRGPTTGIFTGDGGGYLPESTACLQPTLMSSLQETVNETHNEEPTLSRIGQQPFFWGKLSLSNMCCGDTRWPLRPPSVFLKD